MDAHMEAGPRDRRTVARRTSCGARTLRVLGIAGSLREGSFNRALIRAAAELSPSGVEVRVFEGLRDVPPYDQDEDGAPAPPGAARLRKAIRAADALLLATPEYNHSIPGVLKNAVDWASRPYGESSLHGRPAAVIGASTSRFGAKWAQEDLRRVLDAAGAEVLDVELEVDRAGERVEGGRLTDADTRRELAGVLAELVEAVCERSPARAAC